MLFKNRIQSHLIIIFCLVLFFQGISKAVSSEFVESYKPKLKYAPWLEEKSEKTLGWVKDQTRQTLRKLEASSNYELIKNTVLSKNSSPYVLSQSRSEKFNYILKYEGVGNPQTIYRTKINGAGTSHEAILDTRSLKADGSFTLLRIYADKNDSHLIIMGTDNGSTDRYNMYVYDLKNKKIISEFTTNSEFKISWKSNTEFYFVDASAEALQTGEWIKIFDIKTQKASVYNGHVVSFVDESYQIALKNNQAYLVSKEGSKLFLPKSLITNPEYSLENIRVRENAKGLEYTLYTHDYRTHQGRILIAEYNKKTQKTHWRTIFKSNNQQVFDKVSISSQNIIATLFWGADVTNYIFTRTGEKIAEIKTPSCCHVSSIEVSKDQLTAKVYLTSYFKSKIPYIYSFKEGRFLNSRFAHEMTRYDGIDYISYINWVESRDGTKVPVRISHRRDLKKNSQNPSYIYVYGGFNLEGYMRAFNDSMNMFWMKNGGIVAAPAVRGGNELGPHWHEEAVFERKYKTFEDIQAVSKWLHDKKLSSPEITALEGTSNGGMVAAATGLRFPKDIGVVISVNGVDDLLRKEVLDPQFGAGWSYEYGDSRTPKVKNYLKQWSPVYKAQELSHPPHVLVLNGREDSRVNPAHSFKLAHALEYHSHYPEKIDLISMKNSGHWMVSILHQNTLGWISQTLKWTWVFDTMKIQANP